MAVYVAPVMLPRAQASDFYRPERFPNWEDKYRVQMQYTGFRGAILSTIRNMVKIDAITEYKALGKQGYPIVLFWGQEDQSITTVEWTRTRSAGKSRPAGARTRPSGFPTCPAATIYASETSSDRNKVAREASWTSSIRHEDPSKRDFVQPERRCEGGKLDLVYSTRGSRRTGLRLTRAKLRGKRYQTRRYGRGSKAISR